MSWQQPILDFPYIDMRVLNDGQTLELSNAQLEDAGNYSCRAINSAGVDDMDLTLQVFSKLWPKAYYLNFCWPEEPFAQKQLAWRPVSRKPLTQRGGDCLNKW